MANILKPRSYNLPERLVTPEHLYLNRRQFIKSMGVAGIGAWALLNGCAGAANDEERKFNDVGETLPPPQPPYPVKRNDKYVGGRDLTPEKIAASYNNYYEFSTDKDRCWRLAQLLETRPWQIEISGEVAKPLTVDIDELLRKMPLEERVYRHRCVEAWSMVVPWSGFPMKALIDLAAPTAQAKYVRMVSFHRPQQAPGQKTPWYPWPYYEGLTMAEATNELTFLVTGIYGHELPKQHGAPLRLATPWKYGFKSIKGIVKFEFLRKQPPTFWNDLQASEYDFAANVNPNVPHPRWSQATERDIGTGKQIPTVLYNGYGEYVAHLYG